MPTYDYQCSTCDEITEIFHSIKDAPKRKCPHCGKLTLKRLISGGAGVLFKGDGFYITDSKKTSSTKKTDTDTKSTDKKSASTSEGTTESTTKKEKKESVAESSSTPTKTKKAASKKSSSSSKA